MTTQALNRPVDVLAVLDEAHDWLYRSSECRGDDERAERVKCVRAAVAELIEAARGATEERYHDGVSSKAACDRLVAALAAIGSAK